jgi:hypothetical protein
MRYKTFNARWVELCDQFLPVFPENSIWRYSRRALPDDPEQGWKLHVSATILTANRVMEAVGPVLQSDGILYKAPASLADLGRINSGLYYGYSQVGKFLTVYPRTTEEALRLAGVLHRLTYRMPAPVVPFDSEYGTESCIYYRYGAFKALEFRSHDGGFAVRDPAGNLVPDLRESAAKPEWVSDPFPPKCLPRSSGALGSPLRTTFRAFRALAQRGKGGVYQAFDLSAVPPRLCVLKEGRKQGEVSWDGRDGFWRVRHERRVLSALAAAGVAVPRVYSSFEAEKNYYLAVEFITGESLEEWLTKRRRRLPLALCLRLGIEIASLLSQIHGAGWVWRDCKPANLILTRDGKLRPIDFEGACPVKRPDPMLWGTPSYAPPESGHKFEGQSRLPEDLYALGTTVYLLLAGCLPDASPSLPLERLRRNVSPSVLGVVTELLDPNPRRRPRARNAARRLKTALAALAGAATNRVGARGGGHID